MDVDDEAAIDAEIKEAEQVRNLDLSMKKWKFR